MSLKGSRIIASGICLLAFSSLALADTSITSQRKFTNGSTTMNAKKVAVELPAPGANQKYSWLKVKNNSSKVTAKAKLSDDQKKNGGTVEVKLTVVNQQEITVTTSGMNDTDGGIPGAKSATFKKADGTVITTDSTPTTVAFRLNGTHDAVIVKNTGAAMLTAVFSVRKGSQS